MKDIDHEDDYLDDDRHTVVTVEAVHVSRDGLHRKQQDDGSEDEDTQVQNGKTHGGRFTDGKTVNGDSNRIAKHSRGLESRPKKKRKKFRYESKAERKVTRSKERTGKRAKAKARRE